MPDSLLPGLANLLAYPVEQGGVDQQRMQQWAVTQQMLQGLAQPPAGTTGTPPLTAEQIAQMNPRPQPSVFPGLIQQHPLAAGIPLRAVGALGQVLQIVTGARGGAEAPRPVGVKELLEMRRTQSLDAFRRQQAETNESLRLMGMDIQQQRADTAAQALRDREAGGGEKEAKSLQDELLRQGRAKGLKGQELADFVRQGGAPSAERDLDRLGALNNLGRPLTPAEQQEKTTLEWKEQERIKQAGGKAGAVGERRTAAQQLVAIGGAKAMLGRGKEAVAKLLATTPPELLTQPMTVWLKRFEGDPAAIDARLAILGAPELAKSMGLTSRFNQTEFNLYAGALNPEKMSAREYLATMDRLSSLLDDEEKRLRGPSAGTTTGGPPPSTDPETEKWHNALDQLGVPR